MTFGDQYKHLLEEVASVALNCHRDPEEIQVIAVSKQQSIDALLKVKKEGCLDFGENRVDEAKTKISETPKEIRWHFIGTLQKNKVNKVIGSFHLIHSVDSFELARKISFCSDRLSLKSNILLQVNTSGEVSKHGFTPEECLRDINKLFELRGVNILGLMTMAPQTENKTVIRSTFSNLRDLKDQINHQLHPNLQLKHLSMGMTHDFPLAIEEGATLLRIGTKIFNPH